MIQAPEPKSTWTSAPGSDSMRRKGKGVDAPSLCTNRLTDEYEPVKPCSEVMSWRIRWADRPCSSLVLTTSRNDSHSLGLPGDRPEDGKNRSASNPPSDPAVEMAGFGMSGQPEPGATMAGFDSRLRRNLS